MGYWAAHNADGISAVIAVPFSTPNLISNVSTDTGYSSSEARHDFSLTNNSQVYYLNRLASEAAPDAATILSLTSMTLLNLGSNSVLADSLDPNTSYMGYLLVAVGTSDPQMIPISFTTMPLITSPSNTGVTAGASSFHFLAPGGTESIT